LTAAAAGPLALLRMARMALTGGGEAEWVCGDGISHFVIPTPQNTLVIPTAEMGYFVILALKYSSKQNSETACLKTECLLFYSLE
jgi:hypothetical protein